ncbi:MAG: hypothetical protein ACOYXC_20615 [Candidatus Rifleibacteriota bacterium]
MLSKKAFTMVELVITLALVCGAVILWAYVLSVSRARSEDIGNEQSFVSLRAALIYRLKKDIRSSRKIQQIDPGKWQITVVSSKNSDYPEEKTVIYQLSDNGKKISVTEEGGTKNYDFTQVLGDQKLNFKIIP